MSGDRTASHKIVSTRNRESVSSDDKLLIGDLAAAHLSPPSGRRSMAADGKYQARVFDFRTSIGTTATALSRTAEAKQTRRGDRGRSLGLEAARGLA